MPNANPTLQMEQPLIGHVSNAEVPSMRDVVVTPSEFIQSQQASQDINVGDVVVISGIVYDSRSGITELDDDTVFQGIADYLPGKACADLPWFYDTLRCARGLSTQVQKP